VAINTSSVILGNRKTELSIMVDKRAYPEYFASGMRPMGTQECDPAQLRESHHISRISDDSISGPDGTGNWNPRITARQYIPF
jgi:hypothetical protein